MTERERLNAEQWVSVAERFPEKGQQVLVWFGDAAEPYMDLWHYDGQNQFFRAQKPARGANNVTHWQPAPKPPNHGLRAAGGSEGK